MPSRMCKHKGCPNVINLSLNLKYCPIHKDQEAKDRWAGAAKLYSDLYNDKKWRGLRAAYLKTHKGCVVCGNTATIVDHIIAHKGSLELFYDWHNLQSMCVQCHDKKTSKEMIEIKKQMGGGA